MRLIGSTGVQRKRFALNHRCLEQPRIAPGAIADKCLKGIYKMMRNTLMECLVVRLCMETDVQAGMTVADGEYLPCMGKPSRP